MTTPFPSRGKQPNIPLARQTSPHGGSPWSSTGRLSLITRVCPRTSAHNGSLMPRVFASDQTSFFPRASPMLPLDYPFMLPPRFWLSTPAPFPVYLFSNRRISLLRSLCFSFFFPAHALTGPLFPVLSVPPSLSRRNYLLFPSSDPWRPCYLFPITVTAFLLPAPIAKFVPLTFLFAADNALHLRLSASVSFAIHRFACHFVPYFRQHPIVGMAPDSFFLLRSRRGSPFAIHS